MRATQNNSLFTLVSEEESVTICGGGDFEELQDKYLNYSQRIGPKGEQLTANDINLAQLGQSLSGRGKNIRDLLDQLRG